MSTPPSLSQQFMSGHCPNPNSFRNGLVEYSIDIGHYQEKYILRMDSGGPFD